MKKKYNREWRIYVPATILKTFRTVRTHLRCEKFCEKFGWERIGLVGFRERQAKVNVADILPSQPNLISLNKVSVGSTCMLYTIAHLILKTTIKTKYVFPPVFNDFNFFITTRQIKNPHIIYFIRYPRIFIFHFRTLKRN